MTLSAATLRAWLEESDDAGFHALDSCADWRSRIWSCPPETRLGVREVAEALGRGPDFVYRAVSPKSVLRLPHAKMGGELVYTAGAVRAWIQAVEHDVVPGRLKVTR